MLGMLMHILVRMRNRCHKSGTVIPPWICGRVRYEFEICER